MSQWHWGTSQAETRLFPAAAVSHYQSYPRLSVTVSDFIWYLVILVNQHSSNLSTYQLNETLANMHEVSSLVHVVLFFSFKASYPTVRARVRMKSRGGWSRRSWLTVCRGVRASQQISLWRAEKEATWQRFMFPNLWICSLLRVKE